MMKKLIFSLVILFAYCNTAFAQGPDPQDTTGIVQPKDTSWTVGGITNINFSQTSLTNWAAGGQSSIAVNGLVSLFAKYKKGKSSWENTLDVGYGVIKQDKLDFQKSDDRIELTSKYGLKASKAWYYSALLSFKTQMAPGYKYPDDSTKISDLLAPAYLILALGMDYKPNDNFSLLLAPLTGKITIVNDDTLSAQGAFGVDTNEVVRYEFGASLKGAYKVTIMKNVDLQTKLELFSNYLENPGNIDVNWETLIAMKINKFLTASITTNLIYDDDINIQVDENNDGVIEAVGPRTQFKEVLAVGLSFKF